MVSPIQHQLQLPIVSLEVCSRIYDRVIRITSNHLCVGGEPKKDACSGFGGAPLVILDPLRRDHYVQVGFSTIICLLTIVKHFFKIENRSQWFLLDLTNVAQLVCPVSTQASKNIIHG